VTAATLTLNLSFPEAEHDELVESGLLPQQLDDPNLSGTIRIERTGASIDGVIAGDAVDSEATLELTLVNLAGNAVPFESGHGDLIVAYDPDTDAWEFALALSGATVDGVSGVSGEFATDAVHIVVPSTTIEPRAISSLR
jgi:hypothetical protein